MARVHAPRDGGRQGASARGERQRARLRVELDPNARVLDEGGVPGPRRSAHRCRRRSGRAVHRRRRTARRDLQHAAPRQSHAGTPPLSVREYLRVRALNEPPPCKLRPLGSFYRRLHTNATKLRYREQPFVSATMTLDCRWKSPPFAEQGGGGGDNPCPRCSRATSSDSRGGGAGRMQHRPRVRRGRAPRFAYAHQHGDYHPSADADRHESGRRGC